MSMYAEIFPGAPVSVWYSTAGPCDGYSQAIKTQQDLSAYIRPPVGVEFVPFSMDSVLSVLFCCMTCRLPRSLLLDCRVLLLLCYLFIYFLTVHTHAVIFQFFFFFLSASVFENRFAWDPPLLLMCTFARCTPESETLTRVSPPLFLVPTVGMTRLARSRTASSSSITSMDSSRSRNNLNSLLEGGVPGALDNQARPQTMEVSC